MRNVAILRALLSMGPRPFLCSCRYPNPMAGFQKWLSRVYFCCVFSHPMYVFVVFLFLHSPAAQSKLKAALARGGANADCTFQPSLPPKILARKDVRGRFICRFCVVGLVIRCLYCLAFNAA